MKLLLRMMGRQSNDVRNTTKDQKELEETYFYAAYSRNLDLMESCLKKGVNPNTVSGKWQMGVLHIAAERGDVALALKIVDLSRINYDLQTPVHGYTPLFIACTFQKGRFVRFLLQKGVNPNTPNRLGQTPLHCGCRTGAGRIVYDLLFYHARVNIVDYFGNTPLSIAVNDSQNMYIARLLINKGARLNQEMPGEKMHAFIELMFNCHTPHQIEIADLLLTLGMNVDFADSSTGRNGLHIVAFTGYLPLARFLVQRGANLSALDKFQRTPSVIAKQHENLDLIEFFKSYYKLQSVDEAVGSRKTVMRAVEAFKAPLKK